MIVAAQRLAWICFFPILCACAPDSPGTEGLQRSCDRDASAWFQAQHPGGVTRETVDSAIHTEQYTFSDHYNPRIKRCFVIASEETSTVYPDKPAAGTTGKSLVDLTASTRLGQVVNPWPAATGTLQICKVESKHCASTREWEELAAPYMER
jgi:hypothetical protein